ncbi:flagellar hook-basal body complex protein FliE [Candidatus Methylospira mobilis]|uniref:Flagellar hook-basal body complex protein FliE n=1 Tax=Candidatus Methylospira mobilis TaxID=1808979 RepID=A0A5Q0BEB9_9GAMM|nr:flagellar hook-basal body complex protein FliE [Candidatus Methylospira mobilis]QFY41869.1 flagellar hook-basal body complex protein FliE [Candidatus Methylospira mobilis]
MKVGGIEQSSIESMVAQLRSIAAQTQDVGTGSALTGVSPIGSGAGAGPVNFGDVLKATLDQVNERQQAADKIGQQFAMGDDSVNISDVMIVGQKANISLQTAVQVRNRLVSAYQSIMSMTV